jgi:hypothetical protein
MLARSVLRSVGPAAALGAVLALPPACGTSAVGVDACKQVESARCQAASACGVSLEPPYHTAGSDVDACVRFYDVACLHGLASGTDPGPTAVSACVAAISSHPCAPGGPNLVLHPEEAPGSACAWLVPPASAPVADAAAEAAEGGDAASE